MSLSPPISRFPVISALILFLLFAAVRGAAAFDCAALKSRIERELQAKGIQSFSLTIVPSDAESSGKTVGTCNGATQKIIYLRGNAKHSASSRHGRNSTREEAPVGSQSEIEKLRVHIEWAFNDKGAPCADCNPKDRPACCSTCSQGGLLPRDQIAAQAAIAARKVGCEGAVGILLETQCQNPEAAKLLALHKKDVCEFLREH